MRRVCSTGPPARSPSVDARRDLGAPLSWDLGFLALSVLLVVGGPALHRRGAAYRLGAELGDAKADADHDPGASRRARSLASTMRWLQWATPATTAGILVLDAFLGEQQRGEAGLLDRPTRALDLRRRKG